MSKLDIAESIEGALLIGANLIFWPLLRRWRLKWGATEAEVQRSLPGDELVPEPKWSYTQAITIHAAAERVWPWLAQIGQGRGGFYSYVQPGRALVLHGDTRIGSVPVPASNAAGDYFATIWGFYLVPQDDGTTRLIARFRSDYNAKFANAMMYGPPLVEPISCVMQRKMLLGVKHRAEIAICRGGRGESSPPGI